MRMSVAGSGGRFKPIDGPREMLHATKLHSLAI